MEDAGIQIIQILIVLEKGIDNMSKIIMMVGCPGSGKSTFAKTMIENNENMIIVSRDEIRYSIVKEDEPYFAREDDVIAEYYYTIAKNLDEGKTVIADATQLNPKGRKKVVDNVKFLTKEPFTVETILFNVPIETCIKRNDYRSGRRRVPHSVIRRMHTQMVLPNLDCESYIDKTWIIDENFNIKEYGGEVKG